MRLNGGVGSKDASSLPMCSCILKYVGTGA